MMSGKCCTCGKLACLLVTIGALNWGLIGLGKFLGGDWNVVYMLLGAWPQVEWIVYILVGLAGVCKVMTCITGKCCGGMCKA
jgi:uncharacterized membrane protein YuzA (DUF378 family)